MDLFRRSLAGRVDLHHDNNWQQSTKHIPVLQYPPCSSDLASCDFFMLPILKISSKRSNFKPSEDIQSDVTTQWKDFRKMKGWSVELFNCQTP